MFNRLFGRGSPYEKQAPLGRGKPPAIKAGPTVAVSEELRTAYKSLDYSTYVQDFINESGQYGTIYSDMQLESAYRVSVYLFAALRRVANLTREVKVVAEQQQGDEWVRLKETHPLNTMFAKIGARFFYEAYLYYAIYGRVVMYKRKTRKGVYSAHKGKYLNLTEGGVAGLHIIPNFNWSMNEDATTGEIIEFMINTEDVVLGNRRTLKREEVVFVKDFDPRVLNGSVSMVSLAINDAISNAAISRWAAHYFMSGAMPLLLVSTEDDPALQTESDIAQYKSLIERAWQGLGRFTMRAVYTDRKLNVQQAGIDAEKVQAPEIDRSALSKIASVVQLAPDLIVPPEGGTQERHIQLIQAAYRDAVLPVMQHIVDNMNYDFGLSESEYRFVIDEDSIMALNAERKILADTELSIFNAGLMSYGEAQERLRQLPDEEFEDWYMINGRLASKSRILRDDTLVPADYMQYLQQAWDGDAILRSEYRRFLGLHTPQTIPDGFKSQLTQQTEVGTDISGQAELPTSPDLPPSPPPQLPDGGGPPSPPVKPSPKPSPDSSAVKPDTKPDAKPETKPKPETDDGDKAVDVQPARSEPMTSSSTITVMPATALSMLTSNNVPPPDAPPPSVIHENGAAITPLPDPPPPIDRADVDVIMPPLDVWLDVGGDPMIQTAVSALKGALGDAAERVTWVDAASYRVLIARGADVPDAQIESVWRLLPAHVDDFDLRLLQTDGGYEGGRTQVVIALEDTPPYASLRAAVASAFAAHQIAVMDVPALEVVVGYAPAEFYIPELAFEARCVPDRVCVGRDGSEPDRVIPSLRNWRAQMAGHYEPDGTDLDAANPQAEANWQAWLFDIHRRRKAFNGAIDEWKAEDRTERLPEPLRAAVEAALKRFPAPYVERAAREAVRAGWFDEEAGALDNPILTLLDATVASKSAPDDGDDVPDTDEAMLADWIARIDAMDDADVKALLDDDDDDDSLDI